LRAIEKTTKSARSQTARHDEEAKPSDDRRVQDPGKMRKIHPEGTGLSIGRAGCFRMKDLDQTLLNAHPDEL
jgi:hypothetical protein